jgi:hypothetical protein
MTDTHDTRGELIGHAQRLHDAHRAMAVSNLDIAWEHGRQYSELWDAYDYARAALVSVLRRLVDGSQDRAWRVYELMLDDTGEGIAYWLRLEATEDGWQRQCVYVCEQALRPDGRPFECTLGADHGDMHEAPDGEGCTVLWRER